LMAKFADQAEVLTIDAEVGAFCSRQALNEKGPCVMPGLVVFGAWISQADEQLYGGHVRGPSFSWLRVVTRQRLLLSVRLPCSRAARECCRPAGRCRAAGRRKQRLSAASGRSCADPGRLPSWRCRLR